MQIINFKHTKNISILALGAESAGNFSVFHDGKIHFSKDFDDLLEEANWQKYCSSILKYLKDNKIKPQTILTDLHPLYKTTAWGEKLAKKFGAKLIKVQHHHAHIFSTVGDSLLETPGVLGFRHRVSKCFYGVAMDGTGFGTDEKIWGGEAFAISNFQFPISNKNTKSKLQIKRIGHLENQTMVGGDLAVREPARMLIGVLSKLLSNKEIYPFIKKYYTKNQFELIYNQLQQNFNCLETSSTGRILDAVSILLGFCGNIRKYKHEPIDLLEKNSTFPYSDLKPKIIFDEKEKMYVLKTTPLFEYLLKNIKKDKNLPADEARRLAATAQLYIAEGLWKIIKLSCHPELACLSGRQVSGSKKMPKRVRHDSLFISGGIANNKIISKYFISKGAYVSEKVSLGDAGISFGQVVYYLSNN